MKFPKKPTYYDWHGVPHFHSRCGTYRVVHYRAGWVQPNGKPEHDYWAVHFRVAKGKHENWIVVEHRVASKSDAKERAELHNRLLQVQIQMSKKHAKKKRSRKSS